MRAQSFDSLQLFWGLSGPFSFTAELLLYFSCGNNAAWWFERNLLLVAQLSKKYCQTRSPSGRDYVSRPFSLAISFRFYTIAFIFFNRIYYFHSTRFDFDNLSASVSSSFNWVPTTKSEKYELGIVLSLGDPKKRAKLTIFIAEKIAYPLASISVLQKQSNSRLIVRVSQTQQKNV